MNVWAAIAHYEHLIGMAEHFALKERFAYRSYSLSKDKLDSVDHISAHLICDTYLAAAKNFAEALGFGAEHEERRRAIVERAV